MSTDKIPDNPYWPEDPYEGFCLRRDPEEEEPEPRTSYESHPLDSSFYEDFRFL